MTKTNARKCNDNFKRKRGRPRKNKNINDAERTRASGLRNMISQDNQSRKNNIL